MACLFKISYGRRVPSLVGNHNGTDLTDKEVNEANFEPKTNDFNLDEIQIPQFLMVHHTLQPRILTDEELEYWDQKYLKATQADYEA